MRLTPFQIQSIRNATLEVAGTSARVRLFGSRLEDTARSESDIDLAERVEVFVGRFGRLQDTLGDKLFPEIRERINSVNK